MAMEPAPKLYQGWISGTIGHGKSYLNDCDGRWGGRIPILEHHKKFSEAADSSHGRIRPFKLEGRPRIALVIGYDPL